MKNSGIEARTFKDSVYGAFATVTKALSNARRLEILDLLVQRPLTVDRIAAAVGQSLGNTSQHLQVLKRAHVVEITRRGTSIEYRLAPGVPEVFAALRRLAEARSPALAATRRAWYAGADAAEVIDRATLQRGLASGAVVLVDVRPRAEFAHGHLAGARCLPLDELEARTDELPADKLIVATCRGPYCVFAAEAVRTLRAHGRSAVRFEDGVAEWHLDGGAVGGGAT